MSAMRITGVLMVVAAVIFFSLGAIHFNTTEKKADLGPFGDIYATERHTVPIPQIVSGAVLVGGLALIGMSFKGARS